MTAEQIADRWERRVASARPALRMAMNELRLRTQAEVIRAINRGIYSKPEDVSPTGRKLWVRTGMLKAGEFVRLEDTFETTAVVITNFVPYAEPRHEANKPGRRQINPARTSHWRDETVAKMRPVMLALIRDAERRIVRGEG